MLDFNVTVQETPSGDYTDSLTLTIGTPEQPGVNAAPSAVWFEVTDVTGSDAGDPGSAIRDPKYHEITYIWDFDDAANATPTTTLNMPTAWKDINKGYGRRVAHVFNDPGTYTVTVTAYEPGSRKKGSQTVEVTVGDPAVVFSTSGTGDNVIIYDPNSDADTSAWPDADVQTTWAGVKAARAASAATDMLILMAPGSDIDANAGKVVAGVGNTWTNLRIGALDPGGTRPTITANGVQGENNDSLLRDRSDTSAELVIYGIDWIGEWDSTTENGPVLFPIDTFKSSYTGSTWLYLLHRCTFTGFGALKPSQAMNAGGYAYGMVNDTSVTNWQDYGIFCSVHDYHEEAFVGCSIFQHPDALSGGSKNDLYNNHGCIRSAESQHTYIDVCDLFSRNGWSTGGQYDALGTGLNRTTPQACIRMNTKGITGTSSMVSRVVSEGFLWYEEAETGGTDAPGNHVIDKVLQVLSADNVYQHGSNMFHGGTTMRNFLSVRLGMKDSATTIGMDDFITTGAGSGGAANADEGFEIYSSTFIDLRAESDTNGDPVDDVAHASPNWTRFTAENLIDHQPNRNTPADDDALLDLVTSTGVTPRSKGPRYSHLFQTGTFGSTVSGSGGTLYVPYASITDQLYNFAETDNGSATNQAYWQAIEGTDTLHRIRVNGVVYHRDLGDIAVSFTDATNVVITNNSGTDWASGQGWVLKLDRTSLVPAFVGTYDATGETVPLARPTANSTANIGLTAYDDFLGTERPAAGNKRGALLTA